MILTAAIIMQTSTHPAPRTHCSARFLLGAALLSLVSGTGRSETNRPASSEEPVQLSPFVISTDRDEGWVASTTLVGSRTNSELLDVPLSIDALTSEFMRDVGAHTLEDAAKWVAGLDAGHTLETRTDESRLSYRGISVGNREAAQSARNFFLWYAPTDTYNVERIDFNKGSNSLMFGDASPGGQATTYTKQARFRNFGETFLSYARFGTHRAQVDVNRRLGNRAAIRINLVQRADRTYVNFTDSRFRAADLAATFRPTPDTTVRLELEAGKFERIRADNTIGVRSMAAPGRGFSTNNRWYYTSDGDILYRTNSNPPNAVDRTSASGDILGLLSGMTQTIRLPNGASTTIHGFDRTLNILGSNDYLNRPFAVASLWVEQRFGKLMVEAAFNQQDQHQDRNDVSFSTTLNVDGVGRPYTEISSFNDKIFGNRVKIGRLTASYPIEFGRWMRQFLVLTVSRQRDYAYNTRRNLANLAALAPGQLAPNHQITVRAYLDSPEIYERSFWERFRPENLPITPTFRPGYYEVTDANRPFVDIRYQSSVTASASGQYFGGRLHSLLGIRHDTFARKSHSLIVKDAIGQDLYLGTPDTAPQAYSYDPGFDLRATTTSAGFSYTINRWINLYATRSESFRWQAATTFDGKALGPVTGTTQEIGLKGAVLDRKLFYTVAAYRIRRDNAAFLWSPDSLNAGQLEDLFNPNHLLPSDPAYLAIVNGINSERRTVNSDERSQGVETTLQSLRLHGVQLRITGAYNEVTSRRDFTSFAALLSAAGERTRAALSPGGDPAMAEQTSRLLAGQQILEANQGVEAVTGTRSKPWSANWIVDYEFPRTSKLRGLRLALSGNWRSAYNLSTLGGTTYRGGAVHPLGAAATYRHTLAGCTTTWRLAVSDFYDLVNGDSRYRVSGLQALRADGTFVKAYRYIDPAVWSLSLTVGF